MGVSCVSGGVGAGTNGMQESDWLPLQACPRTVTASKDKDCAYDFLLEPGGGAPRAFAKQLMPRSISDDESNNRPHTSVSSVRLLKGLGRSCLFSLVPPFGMLLYTFLFAGSAFAASS